MGEADLIPMLVLSRALGLLIVAVGGGSFYGFLLVWKWIDEKKEQHAAHKKE